MLLEIFAWWLAVELLGLAAFPVLERLACSSLKDGGYSVSKIFGIVFVTYLVWILGSLRLLKYGPLSILLAIAALAAVSAFFFEQNRHIALLKNVVKIDVIFTLAFLFFVLVRAHNPDIAGAEKPMDFAILNSIGRSDYFPPQDPWFSGADINYYYFGHLAISVFAKLLNTQPAVAYNLAVALIFALSVQAAFGIGYSLSKGNWRAGMLAAFLVTVAGNLFPIVQFLSGKPVMDYWSASRVIPNTINEFPFFSFLFGDLHSHVMAIPVELALILILVAALFESTASSFQALVPLALVLGSLYPISGWYFPTYALLAVSVLILKNQKRTILPLLLLSFVLFYPFHANFTPPATSIGRVVETTSIGDFLTFFGAFVIFIYAFLFVRGPYFLIGTVLASAIAAFAFRIPILAVVLPMVLASARPFLSGVHRTMSNEEKLVLLLAAFGSMLVVLLELFFVNDAFGPPFERMNTVFKYYLQIWIFWAIASAYFVNHLLSSGRGRTGKLLVVGAIVVVLAAVAVYPMVATYAKTNGFSKNGGLDGTAYLKGTLEYGAIEWLNKNVLGTKTILETPGESFTQTSMISSYTGLSTVIGWVGHEMQWGRSWGDAISKRAEDVDAVYSGKGDVPELLKKYDIIYVYVGPAEVKKYGTTMKNFSEDGRFKQVFSNGSSSIYEVTG